MYLDLIDAIKLLLQFLLHWNSILSFDFNLFCCVVRFHDSLPKLHHKTYEVYILHDCSRNKMATVQNQILINAKIKYIYFMKNKHCQYLYKARLNSRKFWFCFCILVCMFGLSHYIWKLSSVLNAFTKLFQSPWEMIVSYCVMISHLSYFFINNMYLMAFEPATVCVGWKFMKNSVNTLSDTCISFHKVLLSL